jgi:hypothetical protein
MKGKRTKGESKEEEKLVRESSGLSDAGRRRSLRLSDAGHRNIWKRCYYCNIYDYNN